MLARHEADAVTNIVTTVTNVRAVGVPESDPRRFHGRYGVDLYGSSVVTTRAFAEKNPDTVRKFIMGLVHGLNTMVTALDASMASLKTYDQLLNDNIEKERMIISMRDMLITPNVLKNGFSSVDPERLERTLKQVAPVFKIAVPPPPTSIPIAICPRPARRVIHPGPPLR
jgi:NitT/TauT family transport system substrate-binding protein